MFKNRLFAMMMPTFCLHASPDNGGGAGGGAAGGAGDGGGAVGDAGDGGNEKPMSRKDVEELIGKTVSSHINSRGYLDKVRKGLATSDDIGGIKSVLEELRAAKSTSGSGSSSGGSDDGKPAVDKDKIKQEERIAELEKRLRAADEKSQKDAEDRRISEERRALSDALQGKVRPTMLKAAVALLYGEDKRITRDKDGNVVFKVQRKDYTDELSIEEGVAEWLTTPEGKEYLPPVAAGGSGDKDGGKGGGRGGPESKLFSKDPNERAIAALGILDVA